MWGLTLTQKRLHVQTPPVLVAGGVFCGSWGMGSETREIVMAFSREFGETESPPRWDMKMERCLGRWLKGPLFLFELQSEVVMRNRLVLLAALMWCLSGVAAAAPAMDIVLYPSSAQVQVDDTLPVKNGAVAFVVPAGTRFWWRTARP